MADRNRASAPSVRLSPEDHRWLTKLAHDEDVSIRALVRRAVQHLRYWQEEGQQALHEALEIFEAERSGREDERRRRLHFQREYQLQSRRLHDMLRDERHRRWEQETQLRDERKLRIEWENQLRDERNRRAECEKQLRDERGAYGRLASAAAASGDAPYDPTVAKLLALAICSESDGEATAAFAKARSLHHQKR